jgi:hypothetical protein
MDQAGEHFGRHLRLQQKFVGNEDFGEPDEEWRDVPVLPLPRSAK